MRILKIPCLQKLLPRHRLQVLEAAKRALAEYLHSTRALPFVVAENVSRNSIVSISALISRVPFTSSSDFSSSLKKFLRFNAVNEFEFFYESLGISVDDVKLMLPGNGFFLSEDLLILNAACELYDFGFPWNRLGILYEERPCIFSKPREDLASKLIRLKEHGFGNFSIVGICLAFPSALSGDWSDDEVDGLCDDLQALSLDCDLGSLVQYQIDSWYELCKKFRVFYDLGCKKGKFGKLMDKSKRMLFDFPVEKLIQNVDFFCKLDVCKEDVALLILQKPDVLDFDLETRKISVEEFLQHFGMCTHDLGAYAEKYPYIFGRNMMANVSNVMKAMGLGKWFFNKIKDGNHHLLATYKLSDANNHHEAEFRNGLRRIQSSKTPTHTMSKLNFLLEQGFGQNAITLNVLHYIHGTRLELQERFACLVHAGIDFSKILFIICAAPKILNQQPKILEQKLNFLCTEIDSSFDYLGVFPAFLCFNLENRVIPRYRFLQWLADKGVSGRSYSIASIVATSEKKFVSRIYWMHPPAVKHYLEGFLCKKV